MKIPFQIAMDGTAASGKTTVGKIVAEKLGYVFFDTGIMYRVAAYAAVQTLHEVTDETAVTELVEQMNIKLVSDPADDHTAVLWNGKDITGMMHLPEVDRVVSTVAAYPGVRHALTAQQRSIGLKGKVVMVGRDIGTVVMPDAELKVYLIASAETRARRRYNENIANGITSESYDDILAGIRARDEADQNRKTAPLKPAEDAIQIITDEITAEQVADKILDLMK